jgi:hypothetical protein
MQREEAERQELLPDHLVIGREDVVADEAHLVMRACRVAASAWLIASLMGLVPHDPEVWAPAASRRLFSCAQASYSSWVWT